MKDYASFRIRFLLETILPVFLLACASALLAETPNYSYDDAGRLIAADYGAGRRLEYTYDSAGSLLRGTTVGATNHPPALDPIAPQVVNEGSPLSFTSTATDVDVPAQTLTFSLSNAPPGATISPATGVFAWTPAESQGPSTNVITVIVTDDGAPNRSDEKSFTVVVNEVNERPFLPAIADQSIVEGQLLTFTNLATDADVPLNVLTFTLAAGTPPGAAINAASGVFTWTPSEAQGPGTNQITVIVTDDGLPSLSATQSFTVIVLETNSAPVLTAIPSRTIHAGTTLVVSSQATDADIPPNALQFGLDASPAGAVIDFADGLLTWTPDNTFVGTTNAFTVRVSDDGMPNLSDTTSFLVNVVSRPVFGSITLSNGVVHLSWSAVAGERYLVQWRNNLDDTQWDDLLPEVLANGSEASQTDSATPETQKFYRVILVP